MKQKLLYTIIALLSAGFVSAQKPWSLQGNFKGEKSVDVIEANSMTLGYASMNNTLAGFQFNSKVNTKIKFAIKLPKEYLATFVGNAITKIIVGTGGTTTGASVFLTYDLNGTPFNTQTFTPTSAQWNTVTLNTQYIIEANKDIYVGFAGTAVQGVFWVDYLSDYESAGDNFNYSTDGVTYVGWGAFGYNSPVLALVEGNTLPQYDLNLKSVNIPSVVKSGQQFTISGTVNNAAAATITSFDVQYKIGTADLQTQTFSGLNIASRNNYSFSINATTNETGASLPVTLKVTNLNVNQTDENPANNSYSTTIAASNTVFPRKFVEEEGTSSGCGYCPRGIVGMAYMKATYPQRFIGISVHGNMSWADPMIQTAYLNGLSGLGLTGFPEASYNRLIMDDPAAESADYYYHFMDSLSIFSLSTNANYHDATKTSIDITTSLTSVLDVSALSANLAYVIIENNVHGTASGYNQSNYYAGGSEVMGGFESKPNPVPAAQMYYQEVARGIFPSFKGANGSVPTQLTANVSANYNYKITLPTSILNKDNIELITLLIDNATGEILNADKTEVKNPTGINNLGTFIFNAYVENQNLYIESGVSETIHIYTVSGVKVYTTEKTPGITSVSCDQLPKGILIVKGSSGWVKKVINK